MLNFDDYEVLTFDCYGTLIDWESGILSAIRPVLSAHELKVTDVQILELYAQLESKAEEGEFHNYKSVLRTVMEGFGNKFNILPSHDELECLAQSMENWRPFPDTVESLNELKRKYKLAIISNVDDDLFSFSEKLLQTKFDYVITAEQVRSYKPSLNNFNQAIKRMGISMGRILHVAQSTYHDIVPAKKMGLSTVWVNRRKDNVGFGATLPAHAQPHLEVPDLKTLVSTIGLE